MTRLRNTLILLPILALAACKAGKDSVLFVTRTNVGVDFDTVPPATDIGYTRQEFMVAPEFEDGQVLPVMTTIGTHAGTLDLNSKQSFATGDAALVLSDAFLDETRYNFASQPTAGQAPPTQSPFVAPTTQWSGRIKTHQTDPSGRKRYFFGTDTTLGLRLAWDETGAPSSASLGYKRKELAYVPLITSEVKGADNKPTGEVYISLPALIATAGVSAKAGDKTETGIEVSQSYATGAAATLLATHPELRRVVLPYLVESVDKAKTEREKVLKTYHETAASMRDSVNRIKAVWKDHADKHADIRKLAGDRKIVEASVPDDQFLKTLDAYAIASDGEHRAALSTLADDVENLKP